MSANSRDEMNEAIQMAHAHDGPVVLDLHVDRVENVYPMIVPGTGVSSVIEDPR